MPSTYGPNHVKLMLSHSASNLNTNRTVELTVMTPAGDPLLRLSLDPAEFATLMASREVTATTTVPLPSPCPDPDAHRLDCAETNRDLRGDCDGTVASYRVTAAASVHGRIYGEFVELCANHVSRHRPYLSAAGRVVKP